MERASEVTRCVGSVGFVVIRWLSAVCNVPALCAWLTGAGWLLAGLLTVTLLRPPAAMRPGVLGPAGARLLLLTCLLNLAAVPLFVGTGLAPWQVAVSGGLDLLAWGWVLYGALVAARWLWGPGATPPPVAPARFATRHLLLSALIVFILGLQVAALFRPRPTWWPFIDYPLYSPAHFAPARTVHYRLHGLTEQTPPRLVEITAQDLGMSWFVYHTQLIPRLFERPWQADDAFLRALRESRLPSMRAVTTERTVFDLAGGQLRRFPELRQLTFDLGGTLPAVPGRDRPGLGTTGPVLRQE